MQIRPFYYSIIFFVLLFASCHHQGGIIHKVEKGETAYRIAHAYQVNLKSIQKANPRLKLSQIYPGQKILIPGASENKEVQTFIDKKINAQSKPKPKSSQRKKSKQTQSEKPHVTAFKNGTTLKFLWPFKGEVMSSYGLKNGKMHNGIDIETPSAQTLKASEKGKVVYVNNTLEGYENMIILQHEQAIFTIYAHLGDFLVKQGDEVKKGDVIAKTKIASPSFFHFEIRIAKKALDPQKHLSLN